MPPGRRRRSEAVEPLTVEGKVRVAPALVRINYDNPRDARVARMAEKVLSQMLADVVTVGPIERPSGRLVIHIDSLRRKNPR